MVRASGTRVGLRWDCRLGLRIVGVGALTGCISCEAEHVSKILPKLTSAGNAAARDALTASAILLVCTGRSVGLTNTHLGVINCVVSQLWWVRRGRCRNNTGVRQSRQLAAVQAKG